jgi:hypothetical protein
LLNIFEQPWVILGASIIALIIIYVITLNRKLYWLSLLIFACSSMLYLLLKTDLLPFGQIAKIILLWLLPIAILILLILLVLSILKQRSAWFWLIPVVLCIFAFGMDWLVKTDMEEIKTVINNGKNAFENENINALSSIVSVDYQDSYHSNKQQLLRHCSSYFNGPVFRSITKTSMQTEITAGQATVIIVVFITFESEGFVFENYGVTTAKVAARIHLKKEKDKNWRICSSEIIEVNNQPFDWQQVR